MTNNATSSKQEGQLSTPLASHGSGYDPEYGKGAVPPSIREFGHMNWLGLQTFYIKEVKRFMRVAPQTLLAPVISNLLYMTVFVLAFAQVRGGSDPKFVAFLAPGLVMLGMINNASANSSSSVIGSKMGGAIVDVLMPPLSHLELALGYIGGAMTRGIMVGCVTALTMCLFTNMMPVHLWAVVYFGLSATALLGMIGLIAGIWAQKFDQLAVINQFIILPLSFLSGTFYHINILPPLFYKISLANPLFYIIDGFRYGFIGEADGNLTIGVILTACLNLILFVIVLRILKTGWRLKP